MSLITNIEEGYVGKYKNELNQVISCIVLWISCCKKECIVGCYNTEFDSRDVSPLRRQCTRLTYESEYNYSEKFNSFPLEEQIRKFGVSSVCRINTKILISKYRFIETLKDSYNNPKYDYKVC